MAAPKTASKTEMAIAVAVTLAAFLAGQWALDYDPSLAPLIAGGAIVLISCLLTFFASRPF